MLQAGELKYTTMPPITPIRWHRTKDFLYYSDAQISFQIHPESATVYYLSYFVLCNFFSNTDSQTDPIKGTVHEMKVRAEFLRLQIQAMDYHHRFSIMYARLLKAQNALREYDIVVGGVT